jgi:hypothetical protein
MGDSQKVFRTAGVYSLAGKAFMKRYLRSWVPILVMVLTIIMVVCWAFSTARARSPEPGRINIYDEIVGADPGEDPRMNTDIPS